MDRGDDFVLLDVREPHELQICTIRLRLDPARRRAEALGNRPVARPGRDVPLKVCSGRIVSFLASQGSLASPTSRRCLRWIDDVDPTQPKY
jgi:rhodanese-related sulfurtransferase